VEAARAARWRAWALVASTRAANAALSSEDGAAAVEPPPGMPGGWPQPNRTTAASAPPTNNPRARVNGRLLSSKDKFMAQSLTIRWRLDSAPG
jgi:hypothetical protein